ncbi:sacsin N-terminal ATP-binding-like domain-containing protein [Nocardia sp. NPDC059180]|uniref:sacsin N-terminal ATP-binding-like domain-containing protein n=1 Tax=Nocardia sp. NPDC059180 TaxID=3346761 RepID=UPI0036883C72
MLAAWRDSPTRLREDAATEADLVRAGYRDRLLTELAQNAADAAAKAGTPGRIAVWLDGRTLHVSNTGAPLDLSGVHALTALRASGKSDRATTVGRFGVGFTAVLTVSDEIELRSTTGSLQFSRTRTREALHQSHIHVPGSPPAEADSGTVGDDVRVSSGEPRSEASRPETGAQSALRRTVAGDRIEPPALRLVWPSTAAPATGADTEIVLQLRDGIDPEALLTTMRDEVVDLLLELPALHVIRVGDDEFASAACASDEAGSDEAGLDELRITGPGVDQRWWQFRAPRARWLLPIRDGKPVRAAADVLRAPTRSDEELSLPALLIADVPMQPDRRRLLPGAHVAELVAGYADFARALPPRDRLTLVPVPGFARSEADGLLREAIIRELQAHPWLPVVQDSDVAEGNRVAHALPTRASVFPGLSPELADLLAEVLGPLVIPELSGGPYAEALSVLDVHRIGLARLAELSAGLERSPQWWRELYAALEPYVADPLAVEELGALAVPLADGRLGTGPRTAVLDDELQVPIPVHWARLIHPDATHPLLSRLGARQASALDLLSDPGLRAELEDNPGDPDTTDAVLRLAAHTDPAALPSWLGLLELTDDAGESLPADELLLPGAPLREVLVADSPFGTVDQELVDRYGPDALRAVGVGWDFAIVTETDPTGPDHDLPDEEAWWAGLSEDPPELIAVRDLDLVEDTAWPRALRQLAAGERTRPLLADPNGYTTWWLRRFARLDGTPLGVLRHPDGPEFAGLLAEFAAPGFSRTEIDALRPVLADPAAVTPDLAAALLAALADPAKTPTPEVAVRTHALLAAAEEHLDLTELALPDLVRALSGATIDPADAMVLDQPWFGLAIPAQRLVAGAVESAPALATLLDLPLVSEVVTAEVISTGRASTWATEPMGVVLRQLFRLPDDGDLVLHDELRIRLSGAVEATVSVPWWREGDTTHIRNPQAGG